MDNNALLLLAGAKKSKQTIGKAGQQGFGVGVYGGDPSDLTAMGLSPMQGCEDPASENYGNYIHTNGSIMVFIPAFCYRIGSASAPSYERDAENALEIRDAELGEGGGWILHRAFIDGGQQKLGFFFDKYICSKDSTGRVAISVKNGNTIMLSENFMPSYGMQSGCRGHIYDSIILGRARGEYYSVTTIFQWSAIAMLSLAHGQAATSSQWCGWYDANHSTNFPKGNNNYLKDYDDPSVTWTSHNRYKGMGQTGSGTPFVKTTHNGQACGITDVNGNQEQVALGVMNPRYKIKVLKESVRVHDITTSNRADASLFDEMSIPYGNDRKYWGANAFDTSASGIGRSLCGTLPNTYQSSGTALMGSDRCNLSYYDDSVCFAARNYGITNIAGVWYRGFGSWSYGDSAYSFRVSGYAQ